MSYDKNRFINNIYALAKRHKPKIKIGELESSCNVSVGYLARLRQGAENAAPSADLLMAFADRLSVSVDALLSCDYTRITESEQKLLDYLEKLRLETEAQKLVWRRDFTGGLNGVPLNADGSSAHPLFVNKGFPLTEEEMEQNELPESVSLSTPVYRSVFHPEMEDLVPVEICFCVFPGKKILYLVSVASPDRNKPGPARWTELELVMALPGHPEPLPFVHTDHEDPGCLDKALVSLFKTVKNAINLPALKPEVEAIIDHFLK